jgi:integrase
MPRVFKQQITRYLDADGKSVPRGTPGARKVKEKSAKWYGRVPGSRKRVPLSPNKRVAEEMLAALITRAGKAEAGIIDPFEEHRKRPLAEHVADFEAALRAAGRTAKQVQQVTYRVRRVLGGCRFAFMADLSASRLQTYLAELRQAPTVPDLEPGKTTWTKTEMARALGVQLPTVEAHVRRLRFEPIAEDVGKRYPRFPRAVAEAIQAQLARGIGTQTSNHYLSAIKQFCNWLVEDRRTADNPLANLTGGNVRLDLRHDRRPLSPDELVCLLDTAQSSSRAFRGVTGAERHMLYVLACATGLRREEIAVLTPASFDLDASPPTATVPAGRSKNRKLTVQPLPADVAEDLRGYLAARPTDAPVWPGAWWQAAAEMLQRDLEEAGIPYVIDGPDGPLHADFHSLRHSYVALLDRAGVSLKQAMQLARHSDPRLTMARYGRASLHDLGAAVDRLAAMLQPDTTEPSALRATGTDASMSVDPCYPPVTPLPATGRDRLTFVDMSSGVGAEKDVGRMSLEKGDLRSVDNACDRLRRESPGRESHPHLGFGDRVVTLGPPGQNVSGSLAEPSGPSECASCIAGPSSASRSPPEPPSTPADPATGPPR